MSVLSFFKRRGSNSSEREQHEQMEQFAIRGLSMDISDFYSALDSKSEEERQQLLNIYNSMESKGSKYIDPFDISMRKLMILNDDIHSLEAIITQNRVFENVPRDDKPFPQTEDEYELFLRTEPLYRQGTPPESYEQAQEKFHAYEKAKERLDKKKEDYREEASQVIDLFGNLSQIKQLDTLAHISFVSDSRKYSGEEVSYERLKREKSFLDINIFPRSKPSLIPPYLSFIPPINSDVFSKLREQYATKHNISMESYQTTFSNYFTTDMDRLIETNKENIKRIKGAKQENDTQTPVVQGRKPKTTRH